MAVPDYQQHVTLADMPFGGLRLSPGIAVPDIPSLANPVGPVETVSSAVASTAKAQALSGLGNELVQVADKVETGIQNTKASEAMSGFLEQRDALTQKWLKSDDYAGAEAGFNDDIAAAKMEQLQNIGDPAIRAKADLEMTRSAISSRGQVRDNSFSQQAGINKASLDQFEVSSLNDGIAARSDQERMAAVDRYGKETQRVADAGWITQGEVIKRAQSFAVKLQTADVQGMVNSDPVRARTLLADPKNFPALDPTQRVALTQAATERADGNLTATIQQKANFDPAAATATLGRVHDLRSAQMIFDQGIKPIENATGDNSLVSSAGAVGVSQIMPGTARDVARGLGMADVARMSDAALTAKLQADPDLNARLGGEYWRQLVTRYDGNVAAAAAAYNGGPGRADKWVEAARQKFGDAFSPAQLQSVIDIKETSDYVGKLYAKLGAPMDAQFSSPASLQRATNAVGATVSADLAQEKQIVTQIASTARATSPVGQLLQDGYEQSPVVIANYRATQQAAADKGDQEAAKALRDLDYGLKVQPVIRAAWTMNPADLDAAVQNMQAKMTRPGYAPSVEEERLFKALDTVRGEQIKVRDSEPVALGGANGGRFYAVQPLSAQAPLDDGLVQALRQRDSQAVTAHRIYGGSGSPFLKEEASAWQQRYQDAPAQEQTAILGTLARGLSPQSFAAALPQLTGKTDTKADRPALTVAAGLYNDAPEVAQSVISGMNAKEADSRLLPKGSNEKTYLSSRDSYLPPGALSPALTTDPNGPFRAMQDAIDARYADLSSRAKDSSGSVNSARLKQAVDDVTGGVLYHNGAPLIAPARGQTQAQFDGVLRGLEDSDLAGAQTTGGKAITADYLRDNAKLKSVGDGKYLVQLNLNDDAPQYASARADVLGVGRGDGMVMGVRPFVLDLKARKPKAAPAGVDYSEVMPP